MDDKTVSRICIECHTGSKDIEDSYVRFENAVFSEADNLWNEILQAW